MEKKFEITSKYKALPNGKKLFRIKALKTFTNVCTGDIGGWIEKESNLSQEGNSWVYGDAQVSGDAMVSGDAWVYGSARVCGDAWVCGDAQVYGSARVCGDVDYACVKGFGREFRNTTFFRTKDGGVAVACGCFHGTLQQFREKVEQTHGKSKMAKEYLMIADLMEIHFSKED